MPPKKKIGGRLEVAQNTLKQLKKKLPQKKFIPTKPDHIIDGRYNEERYNEKYEENNPTITLNQFFYERIPTHPKINMECVFCQETLPCTDMVPFTLEHIQSRGRVSPVCMNCSKKMY